jgi:hypothetical protein
VSRWDRQRREGWNLVMRRRLDDTRESSRGLRGAGPGCKIWMDRKGTGIVTAQLPRPGQVTVRRWPTGGSCARMARSAPFQRPDLAGTSKPWGFGCDLWYLYLLLRGTEIGALYSQPSIRNAWPSNVNSRHQVHSLLPTTWLSISVQQSNGTP